MTLGACSSHTSRTHSGTTTQNETLSDRFLDIVNRQGSWSSIQVPVKISMSSPAGFSISGRAYMKRGERVFISLRMLGIEIATADIEGDSVWLADKFHRRYVAEDLSSLTAGADITVADLQDLLLGRVFINGEGDLTDKSIKKVTLASDASTWTLSPKKKIHGIGYTFSFNTSDNALRQLAVATAGNIVKAAYSNPFSGKNGLFMQQITLTGKAGGHKLDARFSTSMKSAKWNVSIPPRQDFNGYERIDATRLLKSLGNQ